MKRTCPHCGSDMTMNIEVAVEKYTTHSQNPMLGTSKSGLARLALSEKPKDIDMVNDLGVPWVLALVLPLPALLWLVNGYTLTMLGFGVLSLIIAVVKTYKTPAASREYERQMKEWRKLWICDQCGNTFIPRKGKK